MEDRAIVLFVYKRPELTTKVLEGLKENKIKKLIVFSDGPKDKGDIEKVSVVREIIKKIDWCNVELFCSEDNQGLANSIIAGVSSVLKRFDKVIVLEDDCIPAQDFVEFMDTCLAKYKEENVMSVSGYSLPVKVPPDYKYDVYFFSRCSSWGWGTWKDRWGKVDWEVSDYKDFIKNKKEQKKFNRGGNDLTCMLDKQMQGQLDSWAVRWAYAHYKEGAPCVYPVKSLILNDGFGKDSTHCSSEDGFDYYNKSFVHKNFFEKDIFLPDKPFIDNRIDKSARKIFKSFFINKVKQIVGPYFRKFFKK